MNYLLYKGKSHDHVSSRNFYQVAMEEGDDMVQEDQCGTNYKSTQERC